MNSFTWQHVLDCRACDRGIAQWLSAHPDTTPDTILSIANVFNCNGRDDALWCLQLLPKRERFALGLKFANRVSHLITDARAVAALSALDEYLNRRVSEQELAYAAAKAAAAAYAAYDANAASAASKAADAAYAAAKAAAAAYAASKAAAAAYAASDANAADAAYAAEIAWQNEILKNMT